jgi:cytochrome P450
VLAAANYDALANPDPLCFDLRRPQRQIFTFGVGDHVCPGADLAVAIAVAGVTHLLATDVWRDLPTPIRYRSITNARIPLFPGQA